MSFLLNVSQGLYDTALATSIRESEITFPALETAHVLGLALMAGAIALVDFRLLGLVWRRSPVGVVAAQLLPATWSGFAVMAVTGGLLFCAEAAKMYGNPAFRVKLLLLVLAGLNMLAFHFGVYRRLADWDLAPSPPPAAKAAAGVSLALWAAIIVAGRMIAYFH